MANQSDEYISRDRFAGDRGQCRLNRRVRGSLCHPTRSPCLQGQCARMDAPSVVSRLAGKRRMVGPVRFELTTPCTPCKCATRLRYGPDREGAANRWPEALARAFSPGAPVCGKMQFTSPNACNSMPSHSCPDGGIGRRNGLKIRRPLKACGFDPLSGHQPSLPWSYGSASHPSHERSEWRRLPRRSPTGVGGQSWIERGFRRRSSS